MKSLASQSAMFGLTVVLLGCGPAPAPPSSATSTTTVPSPPAQQAGNKAISLEVLKVDDIVARIKDQKGKIVVVDSWATWCVPCVQEFPELVKLHERHAKDGVVCMSVTLDKEMKKDAALKFLTDKNAAFSNFLVTSDEAWQDKWDIKSIPVVLVFDQSGKLAKKFDKDDPDNQFTYEDVEKFVKGLLARAEK